ncbi:MAG TPA: pyridoxal-dependent decarboxylase [Terriglobales bacterium]|nr:pyridoxal-dependent decarboxylase [Terriglobales bacterium]
MSLAASTPVLAASAPAPASLDPADWGAFRGSAHHLLDAVLDHLQGVAAGPVWQPVSAALDQAMRRPLPLAPTDSAQVARELAELILPAGVGNTHPRFFGWVHGAGTPGGVLAELVAAALNANVGGRDHGAVRVERQVLAWAKAIMGFPPHSSGLLLSGTSMANLVAIQAARTARLGPQVREQGVAATFAQRFPGARGLAAYASEAVHGCVPKAFAVSGLGSDTLRLLPTDASHRLSPQRLEAAIQADRAAGFVPFLLVGTAGTADIGATDDLAALARIAAQHQLWFHVDGAFGALAILSPAHRPRLAGIEAADSLAFDFHKWAHVPYDAGCVLIRDERCHRQSFALAPNYLERATRGTAAGAPWFCDYGPELSRSARAIKVWATLREQGLERLGAAIAANCDLAQFLGRRLAAQPGFELLAPIPLNIVCFRHCPPGLDPEALDHHNRELACDLQESGVAVVSTTRLRGQLALRAAIVNHRTTASDLDLLVEALVRFGRLRLARR